MNKTLPIISYISDFINYCDKEKKLSPKTLENYKRFLEKFFYWLRKNGKEGMKPDELTLDDINNYRLFLSDNTINLKTSTQNYYLIALRCLLSYFSDKNIVSTIPANKINLLKMDKKGPKNYLSSEQIDQLLSLPDMGKEDGLRDRLILELLISTGLKVKQLTQLDRSILNNYKIGFFPDELTFLIKKYLDARGDKNQPLLINYRSRKSASKRLTPRSIEKIVKKYEKCLPIPYSISPENLRWAKLLSILNDEKENPPIIKKINTHIVRIIENYECKNVINFSLIGETDQWNYIEKQINKEIDWLKENISIMPRNYRNDPDLIKCDDCVYRKLSILIISGKISATEYSCASGDFWINKQVEDNSFIEKMHHGKEWHRNVMSDIFIYFKNKEYNILKEPTLNYGRSDLGFSVPSLNRMLYIEVGTVSLYKIWLNLLTMKNIVILVIPSRKKIIEFRN